MRRRGAERVVRFNFILSAAIGFVTASMLATCASPSRLVWEYYDQCARENTSFLPMAEFLGDRSVWRSVSLTILVRLKVTCSWST